MTSVFSWKNSISLCPASFHIPRPNLPVTPGVFWLPTFAFQSPVMKRISFLGGVLVLEGLVGLHRTIQLQLLQHYWLWHGLGLLWYWMFSLELNRDHCVVFEIASNYCISDSFVDLDGYSISFKGFLPAVVDIMFFWVKFTHSSPFSPLISRMSTFTLAISSLTTSNLPWFMDLTCQLPLQYSSLQHRTLLLSPVTCTTGYCFCFGSIPSFSGVISPLISSSLLGTYQPGEFIFQCPMSLLFHTVHGVLKARILKWFAIPFSSGPHFVRTLHHDPSILGGPIPHILVSLS